MPRITLHSPGLPFALKGALLCDGRGHLRYWATVWQALVGNDLAEGTVAGKQIAIERFYRLAEEILGGDRLDAVMARGDPKPLTALLEAFFIRTRNHALQSGTDGSPDWETVQSFVRVIMGALTGSIDLPTSLPARVSSPSTLRLPAHIVGMRAPRARQKRSVIRALPAEVVDDLLDLLMPESLRNPFRGERERWRNYALFILYLQQGLRRAEALLLPANAIHCGVDSKTGATLLWLNVEQTVDDDDPRQRKPSIKTEGSRRQIPVSADVATIIEHYLINYRGKVEHPFLFSSNQGRPLAVNTVNLIFKAASAALSAHAIGVLADHARALTIKPHDLRHTCVVARLSAFVDDGTEMKVALQMLQSFFGWTPMSKMPTHYGRAMFEDRLKSVWRGKLDDRTEFLRQLRQLQSRGRARDGGTAT